MHALICRDSQGYSLVQDLQLSNAFDFHCGMNFQSIKQNISLIDFPPTIQL